MWQIEHHLCQTNLVLFPHSLFLVLRSFKQRAQYLREVTAECGGAYKVRRQPPYTAPCQRKPRRFTSPRRLGFPQAFMTDVAGSL